MTQGKYDAEANREVQEAIDLLLGHELAARAARGESGGMTRWAISDRTGLSHTSIKRIEEKALAKIEAQLPRHCFKSPEALKRRLEWQKLVNSTEGGSPDGIIEEQEL